MSYALGLLVLSITFPFVCNCRMALCIVVKGVWLFALMFSLCVSLVHPTGVSRFPGRLKVIVKMMQVFGPCPKRSLWHLKLV